MLFLNRQQHLLILAVVTFSSNHSESMLLPFSLAESAFMPLCMKRYIKWTMNAYTMFGIYLTKQNRRWSSAQAREFGFLHNTVALLVLNSDVSSQRNVGKSSQFLSMIPARWLCVIAAVCLPPLIIFKLLFIISCFSGPSVVLYLYFFYSSWFVCPAFTL